MKTYNYKLYGVLFIILGAAVLIWTVFQFFNTWSFQSSEIRTTGLILSVEKKLEGGRVKTDVDIPTITFKDDTGKTFTFISDIHFSPWTIQAGEKIPVAYDKNNPSVAHVDQPYNVSLWGFVVLDFVLSLFFSNGNTT